MISTTKPWNKGCTPAIKAMRAYCVFILLLAFCLAAPATTLQYLSLDDLVNESTVIVCGTVTGSQTTMRGPVIYTLYSLEVADSWKGAVGSTVSVAVPGGVANGLQQTFAGAPALTPGGQYLIFLWTSKSGLNVIMGLSQGLFELLPNGTAMADATVTQAGTTEIMLNGTGKQVTARPIQMRLGQFHAIVRRTLGVH